MMFSPKRAILFIDREKVRWAEGSVPEGRFLGVVQELPCSEENIQLALNDIIKNLPNKVRIVMGEEFSYVTRFQKDGSQKTVLSEARALIPEKLEEGWDSKEGEAENVQVMAIQEQAFSVLKRILLENKIQVEAMEAESVAISRMVPLEPGRATLLARYDGKVLLEVVQDGLILATRVFFQFPEKETVQDFMRYVSTQKELALNLAYVQDESGKLAGIFQALGFEVQEKVLDPMVGVGQKRDIDGPDEAVLNILLGEDKKKVAGIGRKGILSGATLREKILLAAFSAILLGGMLATAYLYNSR